MAKKSAKSSSRKETKSAKPSTAKVGTTKKKAAKQSAKASRATAAAGSKKASGKQVVKKTTAKKKVAKKKVAKKKVTKKVATKKTANSKPSTKKAATRKSSTKKPIKKASAAFPAAAKKSTARKPMAPSRTPPAPAPPPAIDTAVPDRVYLSREEVPIGLDPSTVLGQPPTIKQLKKIKLDLSRKQLNQLKAQLLEKKAELLGDVRSMEAARAAANSGDLSHMPLHMADVGSDAYDQEFTLGLMESDRRLLHEIDEALARIRDGYFGVCLVSARPIEAIRLEIKPWAKYCIEVAREREKRGLIN
jgi:DnaK suppressor protein